MRWRYAKTAVWIPVADACNMASHVTYMLRDLSIHHTFFFFIGAIDKTKLIYEKTCKTRKRCPSTASKRL